MTKKNLKFLVVFFSKNRKLFLSIATLAAIVAAVWLIASVTNWLATVDREKSVPWTVVAEDRGWQGTASQASLPRFFVAGGLTYDKKILVEGWGMSEDLLQPVDYMEELGIHLLRGDVERITYADHKLSVFIAEKDAGYKLITVSKAHLEEGDLQIVFLDAQGSPLGYEEEYVYSIPMAYTVVDSGQSESKSAAMFMEILDTETLPVLTGLDASLLLKYPDSVFFHIQGGKVATIQRSNNNVRVYVDPGQFYQVVAVPAAFFKPGQNTIRLIDSSDLSVEGQIIFLQPGQ